MEAIFKHLCFLLRQLYSSGKIPMTLLSLSGKSVDMFSSLFNVQTVKWKGIFTKRKFEDTFAHS